MKTSLFFSLAFVLIFTTSCDRDFVVQDSSGGFTKLESIQQEYEIINSASGRTELIKNCRVSIDYNGEFLQVRPLVFDQENSTTYFIQQPEGGAFTGETSKVIEADVLYTKDFLIVNSTSSNELLLFQLTRVTPAYISTRLNNATLVLGVGIGKYVEPCIGMRVPNEPSCKCEVMDESGTDNCDEGGIDHSDCHITNPTSSISCSVECRPGSYACCLYVKP